MREILNFLKENFRGIAAFGLFDLWLLSFPLEGYLLLELHRTEEVYKLFLITHTATLLSVGALLWRLNGAFYKGALIFTALLTALYPFIGSLIPPKVTIGLLGITSGLVSAWLVSALSGFGRPLTVAGLGLILGNALLTLLILTLKALPELNDLLTVTVGIALLSGLKLPEPAGRCTNWKEVKRLAPMVFLIYLFLGNSYLYLVKEFSPSSLFGADNFIYILSIGLALYLAKKRGELLLPLTVGLLGLSAFTLTLGKKLLSLLLIQASAGFSDLFSVRLILKEASLQRAGIVVGSMVGGILIGLPIASLPGGWGSLSALVGNIVFSGLFILSFLLKERELSPLEKAVREAGLTRESFSKREWQVLEGLYRGRSLREIASEIGISESSVKTYTRRIYQKAGVRGKRELLEKLRSSRK